jgi:hypothetical protein
VRFLIFIAVAAAHFGSARAVLDEQAFSLFEQGDFQAAAERAVVGGGAENHALAARALNALAYLEDDDGDARKIADRALAHAEAAIEGDPGLVEGRLQAAISLAQRGARMAPWRAFFLNVAQRARASLDAALELDPENPWALSSSAAWHLEVSRRGGEGRFGSDPDLGYRQFLAARDIDPQNLVIAYECALRLIAYDREDWRAEGLQALQAAIDIPAQDAFERAIQTRAHDFQAAIAQGRKAERAFIKAQP